MKKCIKYIKYTFLTLSIAKIDFLYDLHEKTFKFHQTVNKSTE